MALRVMIVTENDADDPKSYLSAWKSAGQW